jgi:hypothetical protein
LLRFDYRYGWAQWNYHDPRVVEKKSRNLHMLQWRFELAVEISAHFFAASHVMKNRKTAKTLSRGRKSYHDFSRWITRQIHSQGYTPSSNWTFFSLFIFPLHDIMFDSLAVQSCQSINGIMFSPFLFFHENPSTNQSNPKIDNSRIELFSTV